MLLFPIKRKTKTTQNEVNIARVKLVHTNILLMMQHFLFNSVKANRCLLACMDLYKVCLSVKHRELPTVCLFYCLPFEDNHKIRNECGTTEPSPFVSDNLKKGLVLDA